MPSKVAQRENFLRLAETRTNAVLEGLRLIGNLSSDNYHYEQHEINKIFKVIRNGVNEARGRFRRDLNKREEFRL